MSTNKKRIFLVIVLLVIGMGIYDFQKSKVPVKKVVENTDDKYVNFELEVYDKISKIYWNKLSDDDMSNLFKLSLERVTASTTPQFPKNKAGVEKMLRYAFSYATSTAAKKQIAVNTTIVALYNIPPVGRNQMFSQKQEKQFRDTVANINPQKDLYADVNTKTGATKEEVEAGYKQTVASLKNATTTEAKAKVEKAKYAYSVLSNPDNKVLYDQAKVEPTLKFRTIGTTFYADLSQIAPTTLYELVRAIDNASTTKNDTLIIDFRGNMGGALDFLPAFFGLFVGKDQFAFDLFHQGERQPNRTTQLKFPEFDRFKEIAILTDNMTQSTAELTTATFKKFHMAKVVGKTTRGWGTIENTYPMDTVIDPEEKFVLLLVNSITLREDGQPIEGLGVSPDVDITKPNWQKELPKYFTSPSLINAIKQVVK
jgi:C-terminal processing protease CtpA/Prc